MDEIDQYPSNEQIQPSQNQPQAEASYLAVWEERRNRVIGILKEHNCQKILDLGCGEGSLFQAMKFMPEFKRLVGIDIDMNEIKKSFDRVAPMTYHIFSDNPPEEPLEVAIYKGDLTSPHPLLLDERSDAITMVEVIEHLPPDALKRLPQVLFGFYRPKVIIISTPNKEYNKCIKGFDPNTFRHWDHKFEWTRNEFQKWCETQSKKFDGYEVKYQTVGRLHPMAEEGFFDVERYGRCTQIAVFTRKPGAQGPYDGELECFGEFTLERVKNFKFPSKQEIDNLKVDYPLKWDDEEWDYYEYSEDNTNLNDDVDPKWWQDVWNREDDDEKTGIGNGQGWDDGDKSVLHSFDDETVLHCWKSEHFWIEDIKDESKYDTSTENKDEENDSDGPWPEEKSEEGDYSWTCSAFSKPLPSDEDVKVSGNEDSNMSLKQSDSTSSGSQGETKLCSQGNPAKAREFDVEGKVVEDDESNIMPQTAVELRNSYKC